MSKIVARSVLLCLALTPALVLLPGANAEDVLWSTDIERSLKQAAASGKPVLMEFTASWCVYCKRMEKTTFADPAVAARITEHFVPVRVDADKNKELVADLSIKGLPAILIVSPDLQIIERISGFQTPEALIARLDQVTGTGQQTDPEETVATSKQNPVTTQPQSRSRRELEFEAITHEEATPRKQAADVRPVSRPAAVTRNAVQRPESSRQHAPGAAATEGVGFFDTITANGDTQEKAQAATDGQPAFHGSCLVSAVQDREIVPGTLQFQTTYRGQVLYFRSEDHKQKFLAQPEKYWPMLDGHCPMTLLDDDQKVAGELKYAAVFRKRIWLFADSDRLQEFFEDPAGVMAEITEQYPSP